MLQKAVGKKGQYVSYKHLCYVFTYLCKVDYVPNKFIHAPTINYSKVVYLLELVGIIEQAYCNDIEGHENIALGEEWTQKVPTRLVEKKTFL